MVALDEEIRSTEDTIKVLSQSSADNAGHAIAMLSLDAISLGVDRVYLRTLVDELLAASGGKT